MSRAQNPRVFVALASLAASACRYDVDKLYQYANDVDASAVVAGDASADGAADASAVVLPSQLIDLFADTGALSEECIACANEKCAEENDACRDDAQCGPFTACLATENTPAQREDCRERFRDWLGEPAELYARDISGPFAGCVFQQRCDSVCGTRADLACLEAYSWPTTSEGKLSYRVRLSDTNNAVVPGASVRVCDANVPGTCDGGPAVVSDADGIVDLSLPVSATGAFIGYLEVTGAGLHPALIRFGWPVARSGVTSVTVIPEQIFLVLSAIGSTPVSAERGMMQMRATGCAGWPVSGVSYSVEAQDSDPTVRSWYTANTTGEIFPSFTATSTDALGAGGIINVPPGRVVLRATREKDGQTVAELTVPVRANHITIAVLSPQAAP